MSSLIEFFSDDLRGSSSSVPQQKSSSSVLNRRKTLGPYSVVVLQKVDDTKEWYELKTMDDHRNVAFHYGMRQHIRGTTSSKRLTLWELEQLKDSDVHTFGVFVLFQHTFFANSRFCDSWFKTEQHRLKWHKGSGEVHSVDDSISWFEMTTEDEFGTRYHYGKPGELTGTTSSRRLTLLELGQLGISDTPILEIFCRMQATLLSRFSRMLHLEIFGNLARTLSETDMEQYMLKDILDKIRTTALQEQLRITPGSQYLLGTCELEYRRILAALSHITEVLKNRLVDSEDVVRDTKRITLEVQHLKTISGQEYPDIAFFLDNLTSELRQNDVFSRRMSKRMKGKAMNETGPASSK